MLSEFESRLADVLGAGLPAPFTGRVTVDPDVAPGPGPGVQLAVIGASRLCEDFGSNRLEQLPERSTLHRVVRLEAQTALTVAAADGEGRPQELLGVDNLLYLIDDQALADGSALVEPGDQGFLIESLTIAEIAPPVVTVNATGWFWPVGEPGQDGPQIERVMVRQAALPLTLRRSRARIFAGEGPLDLTLEVGTTGLSLERGQPAAALPFGSLALRLEGRGGRPGEGTLSGGTDGPDEHRIVLVDETGATFGYTPPADQAHDDIVVSTFAENIDGGAADARVGFELARFTLNVEPA